MLVPRKVFLGQQEEHGINRSTSFSKHTGGSGWRQRFFCTRKETNIPKGSSSTISKTLKNADFGGRTATPLSMGKTPPMTSGVDIVSKPIWCSNLSRCQYRQDHTIIALSGWLSNGTIFLGSCKLVMKKSPFRISSGCFPCFSNIWRWRSSIQKHASTLTIIFLALKAS